MARLRKAVVAIGIVLAAVALGSSALWYGTRLSRDKTAGEILRYATHRLEGHPKLEKLLLPPMHWVQGRIERAVPVEALPTMGKGQQTKTLQPLAGQATGTELIVRSAEDIRRAMSSATPGQTVLIMPGHYRIDGKVNTGSAGSKDRPITLRASQPAQVVIEFDAEEGFSVSQPFWIFENLQIRGVCQDHSHCEHAFHVFGKAHHTVIRNNRIEDFNAHIKVNGLNGDWPDDGLVQFNTLTNTRVRETHLPVTPIDIVGADHWTLADNLISNFVKGEGDKISYGVFMKGGGHDGHIERNLIVCTPQSISQTGSRVGMSFGGGGTGPSFCRDKRCDAEYANGVAANNIVAHCNDFGIDVNRSRGILIAHNTLINTAGIDVRNAPASARLYGNLLDGRIRQRDGGQVQADMNELATMNDLFEDADALKLDCRQHFDNVPSLAIVPTDFDERQRLDGSLPGALAQCADRANP